MKLYLAGPMTALPDDNFPAFHAKAAELRALGHEVVNPAENFEGRRDLALEVYFRRDTTDLCACEAVALLPMWWNSAGTLYEIVVALQCGVKILDAETLMRNEWLEASTIEWALARLLVLKAGDEALKTIGSALFNDILRAEFAKVGVPG